MLGENAKDIRQRKGHFFKLGLEKKNKTKFTLNDKLCFCLLHLNWPHISAWHMQALCKLGTAGLSSHCLWSIPWISTSLRIYTLSHLQAFGPPVHSASDSFPVPLILPWLPLADSGVLSSSSHRPIQSLLAPPIEDKNFLVCFLPQQTVSSQRLDLCIQWNQHNVWLITE